MMAAFPPNRWRLGLGAAAGVGSLAFIHSQSLLGWAYADIAAASAEYRQAVLTAGMFAAAVAAWTSSSISSPVTAHAPAGALRRGIPLAWAHLSFLWLVTVAGFTVGLAPATLATALRKTAGSLDIATMASGYACLLAYVAIGYLVGCLLPSYLAVPTALGTAYAIVFVSPTILSPILEFDIISGVEVAGRVSLLRTAFFLACAGVATVSASVWLRMRTTTETRAAGFTVALMVTPLVLVAYSSGSYSGPLVVPDHAGAVCDRQEGSVVCLHPARSDLLEPLSDAVSGLGETAGREVFPPIEVYDATLTVRDDDPARYVIHIQGHSSTWLRSARVDLATHASGLDVCYQTGDLESAAGSVSSAVGAWILNGVGERSQLLLQTSEAQEVFEDLEQLGPDRARQAIERDIADIRECRGELMR
jgi:hypothetical protein